jgi:GT2 family glycosyltransferase
VTPAPSIVIPVYGRAALTRRCIEVVLATVPSDTEIVVVDDASEDETPQVLAAFGDAIRVLTLEANGGFANACNRGAEQTAGELLVFLNNDTEPRPGWLEALVAYAQANPNAEVIGTKLVYPNGSTQHAGVVFGQDGFPHNLYAGFPADHPAVNRSRRLQAVTAACALVRRGAFERAGGFDSGYENSLEDVDLCLRIGEQGGEVHYCHGAEILHLESASRGRTDKFEASVSLYRERWRDSVDRDDLDVYVADGLLSVEYPDSYPVRMTISPTLSIVDRGREDEAERLLETYARQVSDLLQEVVRLTASGSKDFDGQRLLAGEARGASEAAVGAANHTAFLARASWLEDEVRELQLEAQRSNGDFAASPRLGYRQMIEQVHSAVDDAVPAGATVLVVSRGDRALIRLDKRSAAHFPQGPDGGYLGHHPETSEEAIEQLEALRAQGAGFLVVPATSAWWLDHYDGFAKHLERYPVVGSDVCAIYCLALNRREASQ